MKRTTLAIVVLLVGAATLLGAYWSEGGMPLTVRGQPSPQQNVYFGFLLGTPTIGAIAIDLAPADDQGLRVLRAYVCDGLGPPEGMAVWFLGDVPAQPAPGTLSFTSAGGRETLAITAMNERGVYGAFTDATGATAHFVAYPTLDGAGIYQVTLDEALHYTGTSTEGATLDAQATSDGTTTGTITTADGKQIGFKVRSLALASPAELAAHGLPEDFRRFTANNQLPGEYVAVIAPGGSHWFGRSGDVRGGFPGTNIIGLDKKDAR
ncbi:MAG: hypothetical protein ACRDJE_24365 [Dehalococcoidia bacterium]